MSNSVTGPGARLDAESSNLQAYCDRLEAENATLRERVEQLKQWYPAQHRDALRENAALRDALRAACARIAVLTQSEARCVAVHTTIEAEIRDVIRERDALAQRLAQAEQLLADAAQALPDCSGPITHRVQMLRQYWTKQNADLRRQLDEALAQLQTYGVHRVACRSHYREVGMPSLATDCDCGLTPALASARRVEDSHE